MGREEVERSDGRERKVIDGCSLPELGDSWSDRDVEPWESDGIQQPGPHKRYRWLLSF